MHIKPAICILEEEPFGLMCGQVLQYLICGLGIIGSMLGCVVPDLLPLDVECEKRCVLGAIPHYMLTNHSVTGQTQRSNHEGRTEKHHTTLHSGV